MGSEMGQSVQIVDAQARKQREESGGKGRRGQQEVSEEDGVGFVAGATGTPDSVAEVAEPMRDPSFMRFHLDGRF